MGPKEKSGFFFSFNQPQDPEYCWWTRIIKFVEYAAKNSAGTLSLAVMWDSDLPHLKQLLI